MFPHFINYYHQLLVSYKRFLVLLHHDPSHGHRASLERMLAICEGYAMECHAWEGPLSPDALLEQQLLLLRDFVDVPEDWILNVGVDEFLVYPKGLKYVDDLWLRASCCLLFRPLVYMSVFLSMVFLFSVKLN